MISRLLKIFTGFILIFSAGTEAAAADADMNIYAVWYGKSMFQKKFVFYKDKSAESVPFSWVFYYIEFGDKKILVDTGFNDPKMVKVFGITDFKDPVAILKDNGIEADKITDILITHSHFDHIGNAHRFKNAHIIINKDELAELNKNKNLVEVKKYFNGNSKVTVFDQSAVLYDMFTIKKIGGHTKGSSVVFFSNGKDEYCFTGDEVYQYLNITENTGNGSVADHLKNIEFTALLNKGMYKTFIFHDSKYLDMKERFTKVFPAE